MTIVSDVGEMFITQRLQWLGLAVLCLSTTATAVKCFNCVGEDCIGEFCEGDYCMVSQYAPRWGSVEWGEPQTIRGCLSGDMLREDVRDHCEAFIEDGMGVFTCFCNNEYCNGPKQVRKLPIEPVQLFTCVCNGDHCKGNTCRGELCSYVINHRNKKTEHGCINASIPLIERRAAGACMIPPITGAMHHTIAKDPEDLLKTELCICASNNCNAKAPFITANENMKCETKVRANLIGVEMASRTIHCMGEFCFKVNVTSELGSMRHFETIGCVTFVEGAELAEELNPKGCTKYQSEKVTVESCFTTTDKEAIARALANKQTDHKLVTASPETRIHPTEKPYEFEMTALIAVFVVIIVIMIILVIAGVIWKFELHKKVFRANYNQ